MNEYDPYVQSINTVAPSLATTSLDDNPDDGARALKLSQATGVDPQVVYGDLDGFDQGHRTALVSHIVRNNPAIASYIRGNPLADVVSNDDYGNLDNFSRSAPTTSLSDKVKQVANLWPNIVKSPISTGIAGANIAEAGISGVVTGAKEAFTAPYKESDIEAYMKAPFAQRLLYSAGDLSSRILDAFSGSISEGVTQAAGQFAKELGADESGVERAKRDAGALVQSEMMRTGEHFHEIAEIGERQAAVNSAMVAARPWVDAGIEPPRGLHPEIDRAKADLNSDYLEKLDANLTDAQASLTRDRSPELFQKFAEQHYGDSSIGISGDRVAELYGDRIPSLDDGLLGWVPGIADKLEAARLGEDVHIPLADWMTKIDPALAKDLHDDLRVWPGGITANEAKEPWEAKPVVEAPIAQAREAAGLEPMFAIGDRKLELKQQPSISGFEYAHEYQFHDQDGKPVGELTIIPDEAKKELYISNINGLAGLYSNSFGPSLVRDLTKQLKQLYPQFLDEKGRLTVTGHRVSGARETAGTWETELAHPVVKLASADLIDSQAEFENFRQILDDRAREHFGHGITADLEPTELLEPRQAEVSHAIREEVQKISGIVPEVVSDIRTERGGRPLGVYFPDQGRIIVSLFSDDPIGYGRHEAIHHLYRQGFFEPVEWTGLINAARSEGWLDRYGIKDRYPDLDLRGQYEESIAEAYRDWAGKRDEIEQPTTLVTQAFEKLRQLWEGIQTRLKEIFGRDVSADELFRRVESGEVAGREGRAEGGGPAFALGEDEMRAKMDNLRASAAGLDSKTFGRLQKLLQERHEADITASLKRAQADQARTQTKEWKDQSKELAKQVEETIRQRPDVMADLFVGSGEIAGKKIRQVIPVRASDLTPEQRKGLPRRYYAEDGLPADGVAKMTGFTSGDAMIEKLIEYNRDRGDMTSQEHLRKVIADETERQMQARFGDLQKNIMLDAQDQALSENNLNLLAEEWQGAAMQAGVKVVDKDFAKAHALEVFGKLEVGTVDSGRLMTQMSKHYRDATNALIKGKPAEALVSLQRRYEVGLIAAEAKKLEKEQRAFDRTAKQFAKREVPSMEPEYTNFIHEILQRIGKPVRRSAEDVAKEIKASGYKDLEHFVADKAGELRIIESWDQLYDPVWRKNLDTLTTEEFRNVKDTVDSLVFNGKNERKVIRAGEAVDLKELKAELIDSLSEFKEIQTDTKGLKKGLLGGRVGEIIDTFVASHINMPNTLSRWDRFNPMGPWQQTITRGLFDGSGELGRSRKEFAGILRTKIADLDVKDLNKSVDNPLFRHPVNGNLMEFTRKNLLMIMANTGTKSNLVKMAKGYEVEPAEMMSWIHEHATKADWDFVQSLWDGVFKEIKGRQDTMRRSLSGVPVKDVPAEPVQTKFGTYAGGYFPVIYHSKFPQKSPKFQGKDPLTDGNFFGVMPEAGFTKERTGYIGPMALDLDEMPNRIGQMLHDLAMRPAIINAHKIFKDRDIQATVMKHYGAEYKDELIPYLRGITNAAGFTNKNQSIMNQVGNTLRVNMVADLVGGNIGTVMKHTPTALITSIKEVGPEDFLRGVHALFSVDEATGEANHALMMRLSAEMPLRDRSWEETLYGASHELLPGAKGIENLVPMRQRIIQWMSKPVAMGDFMSAGPTWLGKYFREIDNGKPVGDAAYLADDAVRRAHGSMSAPNRTPFQRDLSPWFTSIYNFWSDIMNRQMETYWKAGEAIGKAKEGEWKEASKFGKAAAAGLFAYVLWPAIVEHVVTGGDESSPKDGWGVRAGKAIGRTLSSSWIGVRDIASALLYNRDPQFGLAGTAFNEVRKVYNDLAKDHPLAKDHRGHLLQDGTSMVGALTGMVTEPVGRGLRFTHDVSAGLEHPKGLWGWLVGLRYGSTKGHSTTFEKYKKGISR